MKIVTGAVMVLVFVATAVMIIQKRIIEPRRQK